MIWIKLLTVHAVHPERVLLGYDFEKTIIVYDAHPERVLRFPITVYGGDGDIVNTLYIRCA